MLINKITYGWVTQTYDTEKGNFISQEFYASDDLTFEDKDGNHLDLGKLKIDTSKLYFAFDMVQPDVQLIELFDLDGRPRGILRTNADNETLDALVKEYSALEYDDKGSDDFTNRCKKRYPNLIFELFYTDTERVLAI